MIRFYILSVFIFLETIGIAQNIDNESTIKWKADPEPVFTDPDDDFAKDPSVLYVLYNSIPMIGNPFFSEYSEI